MAKDQDLKKAVGLLTTKVLNLEVRMAHLEEMFNEALQSTLQANESTLADVERLQTLFSEFPVKIDEIFKETLMLAAPAEGRG